MEKKHVLFVLIGLVVVIIAAYFLYVPMSSAPVDGKKIVAAAHAYSNDLRMKHEPLPVSVSLDELIAKGFLKHAEVSGFDGMVVNVYLIADPSQPHPILMRAKLPDGHEILVFTDGTIQVP